MSIADLAPVDRAHEVDGSIREGCRATRTALMMIGGLLHEAMNEGHWQLLGYGSEREWLASPGIELSYSHARSTAQVWRELVVNRGVEPAALEGIDVRKAQTVMGAIRGERVSVEDALSDCRALARRDLFEKYKGDPRAKLDADAEPERIRCPKCLSWVDPDSLREVA